MYVLAGSYITDKLIAALKWVLDPARLIEAAFTIMSYLFTAVGWVMGLVSPSLEADFNAFGQTLDGIPFQSMFKVGAYLISPIVQPEIFLACMAVTMHAYLLSISLKILVWVKGHLWSASS